MAYDQPDKPFELLIEQDRVAEDRARKIEFEAEKEAARRAAKRVNDEREADLRQIRAVWGSDVELLDTPWLWRDRVPLGGLAMLAGKGDTSKSTCFSQFAAWLTLGEMKGAYWGKPQRVIYVVNEDSVSRTVAPRLVAHGADMDRVAFLEVHEPTGQSALMLPRDADRLERFIRETGAVCTFIDPLSANVTGRKNDQGEMRATFQVVNNLAESTGTSIWGLAHTRKAGAADIMEAILGSSEQGNVARSVHGLVMDPEEDGARLLSCEKLNEGQRHILPTLRFRVNSVNVPLTHGGWTSQPQIQWIDETTETASDMLEDALYGNTGVDECAQWLLSYLNANGGEAYSADIRNEGKKFNAKMLDRARKKVHVKSRRTHEVHSRTVWALPDVTPNL